MAKVTIESSSTTRILRELQGRLEDMTPAFKDIADLELSSTKQRYLAEVDPQDRSWPDPITLRRDGGGGRDTSFENPWDYVIASNFHAAPPGYHFFDRGRGDKVLRDTGNLFNSIGRSYGKTYAYVGTNVSYARDLQYGRFPFLGINQKTIENVRRVVNFYLMGSLK